MSVAVVSTVVALSGVGLAAFLLSWAISGRPSGWPALLRPLVQLVSRQVLHRSDLSTSFIVWPLWLLAQLSSLVRSPVIDGLVNLVGRIPPACGTVVRSLQTGMVQFYALAMVLGVLVLIGTACLVWPV